MYLTPTIRNLEANLPDYVAEPEVDEVVPGIVPA